MDLNEARILSSADSPIVTGVLKWKREYNESILKDCDVDLLKEEIKEFTDEFDRAKDAVVTQAEEEAEQDDDGWVTISRHTSKKPVGGRSEKAQARLKIIAEKKRKRKELDNFYKFQMRDAKLARIDDLKNRFESDKQKQIKMKQDRKFKPF
jgi:ribosomal RNA-processing protein 7